MDIPSGWIKIPPHPLLLPNFKSTPLLLITPVEPLSSDLSSGCSIYKLDHRAPSHVSQSTANIALAKWDKGVASNDLSKIFGSGTEMTEFSNTIKNGIRVVSTAAKLSSKETQLYKQLQFILTAGGTKASSFTVSCFTATMNEKILEKIDGFLSSLLFTDI
ncbi:MAG: hypothetical protein ACRBCI_11840 [Cellvibrionaceae bacterium]